MTQPQQLKRSDHLALAKRAAAFSSAEMLGDLKNGQTVRLTYLNPLKLQEVDTSIFDGFTLRVDGIYLAKIFEWMVKKPVERASFDFSSLATSVFDTCSSAKLKIALVGAKDGELSKFRSLIQERFSCDVVFVHHGYFEIDQAGPVIEGISESSADVVIVGMGGTKQDKFASILSKMHDKLSIFTCGAFISQTASGGEVYYPSLIKKLDLRWAYRFINEPRTIVRVLRYYPIYVLRLVTAKR